MSETKSEESTVQNQQASMPAPEATADAAAPTPTPRTPDTDKISPHDALAMVVLAHARTFDERFRVRIIRAGAPGSMAFHVVLAIRSDELPDEKNNEPFTWLRKTFVCNWVELLSSPVVFREQTAFAAGHVLTVESFLLSARKTAQDLAAETRSRTPETTVPT
jgi:hypothetical protein